MDGKEVGLADLKIGTTLSATFKTVTQPVEVKTATIKDGEVVKVSGANLTTKEKDGFHNYIVPKGFKFLVDGKETGIESLGPGMKLNATIVTTSAAMTTETTRGGATGKAPAEPTAAAAAAPPPAAPAPCGPRTLEGRPAAPRPRRPRPLRPRPRRPPRRAERPPTAAAGPREDHARARASRRLVAHDDDRHRPHRPPAPDRARGAGNEEGRMTGDFS